MMEAFQIPVTAVISIIVGCSALAFTYFDPAFHSGRTSLYHVGDHDVLHTTEAERLFNRLVSDEKLAYELLPFEMKRWYGDRAGEIMLQTVEQALVVNTANPEMFDRLQTLKGMAFSLMGSREQALTAYRAAVDFNPGNATARERLDIIQAELDSEAQALAAQQAAESGAVTEQAQGEGPLSALAAPVGSAG